MCKEEEHRQRTKNDLHYWCSLQLCKTILQHSLCHGSHVSRPLFFAKCSKTSRLFHTSHPSKGMANLKKMTSIGSCLSTSIGSSLIWTWYFLMAFCWNETLSREDHKSNTWEAEKYGDWNNQIRIQMGCITILHACAFATLCAPFYDYASSPNIASCQVLSYILACGPHSGCLHHCEVVVASSYGAPCRCSDASSMHGLQKPWGSRKLQSHMLVSRRLLWFHHCALLHHSQRILVLLSWASQLQYPTTPKLLKGWFYNFNHRSCGLQWW